MGRLASRSHGRLGERGEYFADRLTAAARAAAETALAEIGDGPLVRTIAPRLAIGGLAAIAAMLAVLVAMLLVFVAMWTPQGAALAAAFEAPQPDAWKRTAKAHILDAAAGCLAELSTETGNDGYRRLAPRLNNAYLAARIAQKIGPNRDIKSV